MAGTEENLSQIGSALLSEASTRGRISGSRAGLIARTIVPDFTAEAYGVRNLRELIEKHIPGLKVIGFSGPDPLYAITESADQPGSFPTQEDAPGELWRVWVSPDAQRALAINSETGTVRSIPANQEVGTGEVRLAPAGKNVHLKIAAEFLNGGSLPKELIATLRGILSDPQRDWWRPWIDQLRATAPDAYERWHEKRRAGLLAELRQTVDALGLMPGETADRAFDRISAQRIRVRARPAWVSLSSSVPGPASHPDGLREIVRAVVGRMGHDELRTLSLPVGLVLDAISNDLSRR